MRHLLLRWNIPFTHLNQLQIDGSFKLMFYHLLSQKLINEYDLDTNLKNQNYNYIRFTGLKLTKDQLHLLNHANTLVIDTSDFFECLS